jgi:hypothetical protein
MKSIEITFPKLNHFWLDSGLLGLAVILKEVNGNIQSAVTDVGLTMKGTEAEIREAMAKAYDLLIERYYDTSTKKQKDDTKAYNFYYDSNEDKFIAFPKKKAVGIANLIYNKAPRPVGTSVKWEKKIKEKKVDEAWIEMKEDEKVQKGEETRKRYVLPNSHAKLQKRMDEFLDKHGLDVTTVGLLIDGPNKVQPNVNIPKKFFGETKGQCYLCGEDGISLEEAGQTIFPFITGSSGLLNFNTLCSKPEKVCWKCAFIGKFVPVNGFYLIQGGDLFAFFPYSVSFEKMMDVYSPLQDAKYEDPDLLLKNFQHPLGFEKNEGGWFQKPFEVAFAFLYTLYRKVLLHQIGEADIWEEMCNLTVSKAPLEFVVLHAESKGQTSMGKMVWQFRDSVYFFRLMEILEKSEINIKEVMRLLIDFSQKSDNKTLIRNKVCERILKKKSLLDLVESHVFSANMTFIKPLVDFTIKYEPIIREEGKPMTIDAQDAAVILGKRIGMTVAENGKKGDLFALRKARRKTDFLNELNRLQFKCKLVVPPDVYEGQLTDSNFVEFKQFCMIAALNSFYAATHSK